MNVALIGCGGIAAVHAKAINQLPHIYLTTLCDCDLEHAKTLAQGLNGTYVLESEAKKVFLDPNIDAVHILTPHYLHGPMAIEALAHGKHVVLEKPVAISLSDFTALEIAEKQSKATLNIIMQNRFNPTTQFLWKHVTQQTYGKLLGMKSNVNWSRTGAYYSASPWRGQKDLEGGGLLINQCLHTLDLMQWLGGGVQEVLGSIANLNHPDLNVEDTAMIFMTFMGGQTGHFYGTNNHWTNDPITLEMTFEKAVLRQIDETLWCMDEAHPEGVIVAKNEALGGEKSYWGKSHEILIHAIYEHLLGHKGPVLSLADAKPVHDMIFNLYDTSRPSSYCTY